jgi:hypothetical protein
MRYRLRTLMIVMAVVPPVAALLWWLLATERLPLKLVAIPFIVSVAAVTAIVIVWLCELADYVGLLISGKRKIEIRRSDFRYRLRTLVILLGLGPLIIAIVSGASVDGRLLLWIAFAIVVAFPAAWLLSKVASALIFYCSHEDNRK